MQARLQFQGSSDDILWGLRPLAEIKGRSFVRYSEEDTVKQAGTHPQFIKLDMSLVRGVHLEPRKQRLVQLMCTFGVATEAQVIAEGVEELDEAKALVDCGIQLMQGYYFGRPG
jgi:EAL domain-containing protein (putative c-di-GMP-specific phosphodiesterase class I)